MSVFHQNILDGASGAGGAGAATYVDDVFSTHLWEGDGGNNLTPSAATVTVNNGIDLSGEGGLVWIKNRSTGYFHWLFDTERGGAKRLISSAAVAEEDGSQYNRDLVFNSSGFVVGEDTSSGGLNTRGDDHVSWTFRKAPGFFDVVTYTGTGSVQNVSHSLGSEPGAIFIKKTSGSENWAVYHRSAGNASPGRLNTNDAFNTSANGHFNSTTPTSSVFTVNTDATVNENGATYVAYIFAHDDQSFGTDSDEAIIKCGSYTGTGGSGLSVDLGFQPQFVLVKNIESNDTNWIIFDMMRGMDHTSRIQIYPNASSAEFSGGGPSNTGLRATVSGFSSDTQNNWFNSSNEEHIYVAIRHPNKPPEAGTDVFTADASGLNAQAGQKTFDADHYVDLVFHKHKTVTSQGFQWFDRLRGGGQILKSNNSNAELDQTTNQFFDIQDGVRANSSGGNFGNYVGFMFKRAPGFLDIVAYTGTGSATTINHNLGAVPSVVLVKQRDSVRNWYWQHYALGANTWLQLNLDESQASNGTLFNSTLPTSSVFSVSDLGGVNGSGNDYIAYLFGDLDGISKAGTYTGTGSSINVDCGFTAGARFVVIKRADSSGDWYVWNSSSGINSGTDPYLLLNKVDTVADSYDYIDPLNAGFTVTSSAPAALNASGGTYIFLAIA